MILPFDQNWTVLPAQVAFDDLGKVAYLIGGTNVTIIDMSPTVLTVTKSAPTGGSELPLLAAKDLSAEVTDVQFCGEYVAISTYGAAKTDAGKVHIFSRYKRSPRVAADPLELLRTFTVGECLVSAR